MGYRPYIRYFGEEYGIELGKFYGYVNLEDLPSIKYLKDHYLIPADENPNITFMVQFGPEIIFPPDQFREWFDLYCEDARGYTDQHMSIPEDWNPLENDELYAMYNDERVKVVEWG